MSISKTGKKKLVFLCGITKRRNGCLKVKHKLLLILILVLLISGCCKENQYFLDGGVVEHDNNLKIAYMKCSELCDNKWLHRGKPTPMIKECTEKQCFCIC